MTKRNIERGPAREVRGRGRASEHVSKGRRQRGRRQQERERGAEQGREGKRVARRGRKNGVRGGVLGSGSGQGRRKQCSFVCVLARAAGRRR
eukprot:3092700-Pleurochrysis_carterae.AAC.2